MLFNSYEFIFALLPISFLGNWALHDAPRLRLGWLLACSLIFYAWWNPPYLLLLLASVFVNFAIGNSLLRRRHATVLVLGIVCNLALISFYKYGAFAADTAAFFLDSSFQVPQVVLPLAISFFTFQQIAYLVDCYLGDVRKPYGFLEYSLFVSFFPQLIAGPIVHHSQLIPQLQQPRDRQVFSNLAVGLTIFSIGLFKKAVLADGIAPYANELFDNPDNWARPTLLHAWLGVLAYGMQIYFDFSGYSDMALGAARVLGVKLPLNFFAPYRATTISDFWRRWHMTLSAFLRDYLYIPLGGNRHGNIVRYRNLMITMILGGLWHGAGWTFVAWGFLHGIYLVIQHGWSRATSYAGPAWKQTLLYRALSCAVTFLAVQFAWVFFRASSFDSALAILNGLVGGHGVSLPAGIERKISVFTKPLGIVADSTGGANFLEAIVGVTLLGIVVWCFPTTVEFVAGYRPAHGFEDSNKITSFRAAGWKVPVSWCPSMSWAVAISLILAVGVLSLAEVTEFLYFQF